MLHKHDALTSAINQKELQSVSITTTDSSATLIIKSVNKTIQCTIPVATSSQSGIITAEQKQKLSDLPTNEGLTKSLSGKVDKVPDKELSSNDYSDNDKSKLAALPTADQLNEQSEFQHTELRRTGAATPRFSGIVDVSDIDADDERLFLGSASLDSEAPGCAVVFLRSLGIFALRVAEGEVPNTLSDAATANAQSGQATAPGLMQPGTWPTVPGSEPLYRSFSYYLNWTDALDMGMRLGELGYEPVPGVMYMCTRSPYGFMRFETSGDADDAPFVAIRVPLLGDSEDIEIQNNSTVLTQRAKMKLFVDMWRTRLNMFDFSETYELDMANTLDDGSQFGLNGLQLSYEEAMRIFGASAYIMATDSKPAAFSDELNVRTLFPRFNNDSYRRMNISGLYGGQPKLEVLRCSNKDHWVQVGEGGYAFTNCSSLKKILDTFTLTHDGYGEVFKGCFALESIKFKLNTAYLRIGHSSKLNYDSVSFWVNNKIYDGTTTIKVHPDVFAKLTGDTSNDAAAALSEVELTAWTELATLAVSKNISFAS